MPCSMACSIFRRTDLSNLGDFPDAFCVPAHDPVRYRISHQGDTNMIGMKEQFTVAKSPEAVFAYLADFRNERHWNSGMREVRLLTAGPIGLGSRFEHTEQPPRPAPLTVITSEITDWEPGELIGFHHSAAIFEATWRYVLTPEGKGCSITAEIGMRGLGKWRFMEPIMGAFVLPRHIQAGFRQLKATMEGATNPATSTAK